MNPKAFVAVLFVAVVGIMAAQIVYLHNHQISPPPIDGIAAGH